MAECVYRRQGQSFKSFLVITANPGDTVTITATDSRGIPEEYQSPFTMGDAGKLTIVVKKKGDYTVSGSESGITKTVSITKRRVDNEADVSFINTVTVNANPGYVIALSNYDGVTKTYQGTANSNGVATVTVKHKGDYTVSITSKPSNTSLSISPASVTKISCTTNGAKLTINHVWVSNLSGISAVLTSSSGHTVKCSVTASVASWFTGAHCRYKTSEPSSLSDGTLLFDSGTSGTTPSLTNNATYQFKVWPYLTVNGVKYYGTPKAVSKLIKDTYVTNQVKTASGSMTIPEGCTKVTFHLVGGGGGGGGSRYYQGAGGGGGGYNANGSATVTPGTTLSWTVGGGGSGGNPADSDNLFRGGTGGTTYLYANGKLIGSVAGGGGGQCTYGSGGNSSGHSHNIYCYSGGSGGSGGGGGAHFRADSDSSSGDKYWGARNGGSKGAGTNGASDYGDHIEGATGQGESAVTYNNVVYSGGGGGGGSRMNPSGGSGGDRGGGKGGTLSDSAAYPGSSGTSGTGGGGGGASAYSNRSYSGAWGGSGGSGAVIFSLS